jgi:hypothetical protein
MLAFCGIAGILRSSIRQERFHARMGLRSFEGFALERIDIRDFPDSAGTIF